MSQQRAEQPTGQQQVTPIRFGMVGGGEGAFIGAVHRHAAALDGHYQLVCGAFSRDEANNRRTAAALSLPSSRCYANVEQMLINEAALPVNERMQVVVIVTPNHSHVPMSLAAIAAGFHVFCEKPAGVSLAETQQLATALAASSVLYGLAHTYLGYPMVWQARDMVASGALGQLRKIFVEYPQGWLTEDLEASANKQASWRTDPVQAGPSGCMADIGTHAFGLAEFISQQRIVSLCAELSSHIEGRRLDDDGAALFKTNQGASGVLMASQVCAGEENALKIRLYGTKGGLAWQQMSPDSLVFRPQSGPIQVYRAGRGQAALSTQALQRCRLPSGHPEGYLEAMANLYQEFARAIRAGETGTATGVPGISAGLRGLAFIETVTASAASSEKWLSIADVG